MNLVLFLRLLLTRAPLVWANDLDTLLPAFLTSRMLNRKLIYDSHEFYTETPSLISRPLKRKTWLWVEELCLRRIRFMFTVNESIRDVYRRRYGIDAKILKNVPSYAITSSIEKVNLPYTNKRILLLQGAGLNQDRGSEEAVHAMKYLENKYILLVVGSGDAIGNIRQLAKDLKVDDRVIFTGLKPYREMLGYTRAAHLGLAFEKNTLSGSGQYTLPNKLFDFIHAGLPILSSRAKEMERVIVQHSIGSFIDNHSPQHIAAVIDSIFDQPELLNSWRLNCLSIAKQYSWESQEELLMQTMKQLETEDSWR